MQLTQVSLIVILLFFDGLHASTTTKRRRLISSTPPSITHLLVFSSSSETVISFDSKHGWMLNDEKKLHLFLSGSNLDNTSLVFTASADDCSKTHSISPVYQLSSAPIVELHVELAKVSKARLSIFLCLLTSTKAAENTTALQGSYFMFAREKSTIPFPVKVCLILMLFMVSGFFRCEPSLFEWEKGHDFFVLVVSISA